MSDMILFKIVTDIQDQQLTLTKAKEMFRLPEAMNSQRYLFDRDSGKVMEVRRENRAFRDAANPTKYSNVTSRCVKRGVRGIESVVQINHDYRLNSITVVESVARGIRVDPFNIQL